MKTRIHLSFILLCLVTNTALAQTVKDIDGNVYKTVTINGQTWMKANLKVKRYNNGDSIGTTNPAKKDVSSEIAPKYQWAYEGRESNVATYGLLYTFYAATDSRNVCPAEWHLPSKDEWEELIEFLGGINDAVEALKEAGTAHWEETGQSINNSSGFTALPAGGKVRYGSFEGKGRLTEFWTSTELSENEGWGKSLSFFYVINSERTSKVSGRSIRCIKTK